MNRESWRANWNRLKEGAGKTAACAGSAVRTAAACARLRLAAAEGQRQIDRKLREVGRMVYATHAGVPTDSEALETALRAVDALKARKAETEGQLRTLRAAGRAAKNLK